MLTGNVYFSARAEAADFQSPPFFHPGGRLVFEGDGTFGAGTLKLQYTSDNDATWIDIANQNGVTATLLAPGTIALFLPAIRLRLVLAGSAAPVLNCFVGVAGI